MGLLRPSAGRAAILGRDCHGDAVALKRDVGYLPDEPFLYPYLTGVETLELVAGLHGFARAEARRRADAAAERIGLGEAARAYTVTYSLGMKKRLALALALVHEPRVLILDEPTNGLDPAGARQMRAAIAEYAAGGRTIFLSTHLLDAAERLCHRVAILQRGRLQAVATPAELRARFGAGPETTLEELFLRMTGEQTPVSAGRRPPAARDPPRRGRRPRRAAAGRGAAGPRARAVAPQRRAPARAGARAVVVAAAALVTSVAYVGLFAQAFAVVVATVGPRGQGAALGVVAGLLAFGSWAAKAASSEALRAGSPENEFLLSRPIGLGALVAGRGHRRRADRSDGRAVPVPGPVRRLAGLAAACGGVVDGGRDLGAGAAGDLDAGVRGAGRAGPAGSPAAPAGRLGRHALAGGAVAGGALDARHRRAARSSGAGRAARGGAQLAVVDAGRAHRRAARDMGGRRWPGRGAGGSRLAGAGGRSGGGAGRRHRALGRAGRLGRGGRGLGRRGGHSRGAAARSRRPTRTCVSSSAIALS